MPGINEYPVVGDAIESMPTIGTAPATPSTSSAQSRPNRVGVTPYYPRRYETPAGRPEMADVGVLGRTMNAFVQHAQMAPDVAAFVTSKLYAPALQHPQMQKMAANVRNKIGALLQAPAQSVQGAAKAATPAPRPQPIVIPPQLNDARATLHVLLTGTQKPADPFDSLTDDDIAELTKDTDDDDVGFAGAIRGGMEDIADAIR